MGFLICGICGAILGFLLCAIMGAGKDDKK